MLLSLPRRTILRWTAVLVLAFGLIWVFFLDTHSIMHRVELHQQHQEVRAENERLRIQIENLREQLEDPLSDETIERIAREEYGMQYPDETVHRIE